MSAPVVIAVQLTRQQHDALEQLAEFGLFGSTADEVADYLITKGLHDLWRDKMIDPPRTA